MMPEPKTTLHLEAERDMVSTIGRTLLVLLMLSDWTDAIQLIAPDPIPVDSSSTDDQDYFPFAVRYREEIRQQIRIAGHLEAGLISANSWQYGVRDFCFQPPSLEILPVWPGTDILYVFMSIQR